MSNIIDALVYAGIKNNLNNSNYKGYSALKTKINTTSDDDLNKILSNTTIKKACCNAKKKFGSDDIFQTSLPIIDPEGKMPYILKTIDVPKSICDSNNIEIGTADCQQFKTLYCENSNYLYKILTPRIDIFSDYSPYCSEYKLFVPPLTADEIAKKEAEKKADEQLEEEAIRQALQPQTTQTNTSPVSPAPSSESSSSKTMIIILSIICVIILCCSSLIGGYYYMKSKKSAKDKK